jgi:hypothetical protein
VTRLLAPVRAFDATMSQRAGVLERGMQQTSSLIQTKRLRRRRRPIVIWVTPAA